MQDILIYNHKGVMTHKLRTPAVSNQDFEGIFISFMIFVSMEQNLPHCDRYTF